jgi:predicted transcriptional regulator
VGNAVSLLHAEQKILRGSVCRFLLDTSCIGEYFYPTKSRIYAVPADIKVKYAMKVKTSITLSEELMHAIDNLLSQYGTRSAIIEQAVRDFLAADTKRRRDTHDLAILEQHAEALNAEAHDVLSYQVEL